ncbi:MAG: urea carboxylase-associated family protein [Gammaproteobacteria bacterium]|nr:urea carboxylase-associated family protein [Gammaproteobacteria bacterium]
MKLDSYSTTLPGASHWSLVIRRGMQLQITDLNGGANVGMLFYNPTLLSEKYNAPDTLKCQHTFKLTRGNCLYSDMGRIFCSVTDDTFGWHDSVCGNSHAAHIEQRWGKRDYQRDNNQWQQNGYDSFLVELAKYNLSARDMAANVNWFSKVAVDTEGNLALAGRSSAGDNLRLRFEMDTLVILHTCPHPLNADASYPFTPIGLKLDKAAAVAEDDFCLNSRPENQRGFHNNALYHMGLDS